VRLCTLVNNFSPLYEGNFKIAMDEVNTYVSKLVHVASVAAKAPSSRSCSLCMCNQE
jgi:hypothetical protein